jgi:hypothetical protein
MPGKSPWSETLSRWFGKRQPFVPVNVQSCGGGMQKGIITMVVIIARLARLGRFHAFLLAKIGSGEAIAIDAAAV